MLYQLFVSLLGVSRWLVLVLRLGSAEYGRPFHSSGRPDVCHSKLSQRKRGGHVQDENHCVGKFLRREISLRWGR